MSTLDNYHYQKKQGNIPRTQPVQERNRTEVLLSRNVEGKVSNPYCVKVTESKEEKKMREHENLRLVARLFCESGDDFRLALKYIPEL